MDRKKILIAEDDRLNQLAYKGILSKFYDLKICGDDKEFYAALAGDTYDLFIIDLGLNCAKSGIDLLKELRQNERYVKTPVIVATAFVLRKDRDDSISAGANSFLSKPFNRDILLEEIRRYV